MARLLQASSVRWPDLYRVLARRSEPQRCPNRNQPKSQPPSMWCRHQRLRCTWTLAIAAAVTLCAVVLAPVLAARYTPQVPGPVVGYSFGSTNSRGAVYKDGRVEIIANDQGNRITPSYVAFTDTERLIGDAAKDQAANNPENTIFGVKRLLGRRTSQVQTDRKLIPFHITDQDGHPSIQVQIGGESKQFSPKEISAMIFTKMAEVAESFLGKEAKNAVLTMPTYFNDAQRPMIKDAVTLAGLNLVRVIYEPVAAAIAYGLDKNNKGKNIIVYDLGGSTFDVSLLVFDSGTFDAVSINGDRHLGGEDFSQRLLQHFIASIKQKHGIDLTFDHSQLLSALRREVESVKHLLSTASEAQVTLTMSDDAVFSETITRAQFEELTADLFARALAPVTQALRDSGLSAAEIEYLVVIGGASRMPRVHQLLSELFPGKEALGGVEPDEAVAIGAGIFGQILSRPEPGIPWSPEPLLVSLGIRTVGGAFTRVVPRRTTPPTKKSLLLTTCRDNEESVHIEVYQGERALAQENRRLGQLWLTHLPPVARGQLETEVTFEIDSSGDLHVTLITKVSGGKNKKETLRIPNHSWTYLPEEEIERIIAAGEEFAEADKAVLASTDGHEHPGCVALRTLSPDSTDDGGHRDDL